MRNHQARTIWTSLLAPLFVSFALVVSPAQATPITSTYDVSMSFAGFSPDPVDVSFTVTFDPAGASIFNQPVDAFLGSNVTIDPGYVFSYIPVADQITFGGLGNIGMFENTDDISIIINLASQPFPSFGLGALPRSGTDEILITSIGSVNVGQPTPTVPAPATLLMMGLGLAGLGFTRRKMKA